VHAAFADEPRRLAEDLFLDVELLVRQIRSRIVGTRIIVKKGPQVSGEFLIFWVDHVFLLSAKPEGNERGPAVQFPAAWPAVRRVQVPIKGFACRMSGERMRGEQEAVPRWLPGSGHGGAGTR
jgi:hypothetical protein